MPNQMRNETSQFERPYICLDSDFYNLEWRLAFQMPFLYASYDTALLWFSVEV